MARGMVLLPCAYSVSPCTPNMSHTGASRKGGGGREGGWGGKEENVPTFLDGQIHRPFAPGGTEECRQSGEEGCGLEDTHAEERCGVLLLAGQVDFVR